MRQAAGLPDGVTLAAFTNWCRTRRSRAVAQAVAPIRGGTGRVADAGHGGRLPLPAAITLLQTPLSNVRDRLRRLGV